MRRDDVISAALLTLGVLLLIGSIMMLRGEFEKTDCRKDDGSHAAGIHDYDCD